MGGAQREGFSPEIHFSLDAKQPPQQLESSRNAPRWAALNRTQPPCCGCCHSIQHIQALVG